MVVPGMRFVIATSFLFDLVAICKEKRKVRINQQEEQEVDESNKAQHLSTSTQQQMVKKRERTLEKPGDGLISVLIINVSVSPWKGFIGFSYDIPLALTGCRIGKDHSPRAPPIIWSFLFAITGRSR